MIFMFPRQDDEDKESAKTSSNPSRFTVSHEPYNLYRESN